MMLVLWITIAVQIIRCYGQQIGSCNFNSMCSCSSDQNDISARTIHSVSCLSVPFFKFPNLPEGNINQLEIAGSSTTSLEAESLARCQVQALVLTNNKLQHIAERAFSSLWKTLSSLDLSYNQLDDIPFAAFKELRSLQWINLHGNQISSIGGDWYHVKNTASTLFLGENDLTEVPGEVAEEGPKNGHSLRQFKSLIWVNLDGNRIYRIHKHSLPLTLQTVSISHNLLDTFPTDIISSLPNLQWLYLRGNQISRMPDHTFPKKLWLEKIDLGENQLSELPKTLFNQSITIRDLNLAFNDFKTLQARSFEGLQCGRIMLPYNQLMETDERAFSGLEDSLEYLDFDHNNFQQVPTALDSLRSLKYLYLSSNSLTEIPDMAFRNFCHSLKAISFSGNRLSKIPKDTMNNCTKISHFNVAFNEIHEINDDDFTYWGGNIKSLILGNNRISFLKSQVFADLQQLKELSLSFNPLRQIDTDAFVGLEGLENLEISFGLDRDELPYEVFRPLQSLKWLAIDNNNFHSIPEDSFDFLRELKYLNLESNNIQVIPTNLFKPSFHTKLTDVRLSHNKISVVYPNTFQSLTSLETIVMFNNAIKTLESNSFNDLPALRRIVLSDNQISEIGVGAFSNLPVLSKLDLQNNMLPEFSMKVFSNLSNPIHLNLSRNQIAFCNSENRIVNLEILDFRHNKFRRIPKCLENIALLKQLYFDHNHIDALNHNVFMHLTSLERLSLRENQISIVSRKAFVGLQNLQILDLSNNLINTLHYSQFSEMPKLRILDLSSNHLNHHLPKDIFERTRLEMLDLNYNSFSTVPSESLSNVGLTLRRLSMRNNNIEHIDSMTFLDISSLLFLDLSSNKLTSLPDNVFSSLGHLQSLDISSNPLHANFKELFHYAQSLKHLNLANTGITSTPHLPLPNLIHLNLSHNHIEATKKNSMQELFKLKLLDLSHNKLSHVPSHLWTNLNSLKTLDISHNPIKEISTENFYALDNLQNLKLRGLNDLVKFDSEAIVQMKILTSLTIETWPKIENFYEEFCNLLRKLRQLRILKIHFYESTLDAQLSCIENKKIRHLEITGDKLTNVDKGAFSKFTNNPDLVLKITGTQIEELPAGLFSNMYKISYLMLDLRNNKLTHIDPEIFYGNYTTWKNVGTTLISGGIMISNNPFRCGCHLAWFGRWLRRWTRESLQAHNAPVETALRMREIVKEAMCTDPINGVKMPIVQLPPEDMSCQASALSHTPNLSNTPVITLFLLYILFKVRLL
ncbi:chaoptin-like [Coccinella septempunctata]|uniref:chaoptin-like n=1 Tax=Coccinella septempunctata TaxID=41139 RepID=UPI001D08BC94|nr:chaoptin-like [Coccinella septempunctata]XP_044750553.1 chaoptin-like [Coccinella septempunctata]